MKIHIDTDSQFISDRATLLRADCLRVLRNMPDNHVDSIVVDPPYGLRFMGRKWDYAIPAVEVWVECLRVLKPGGYLLCFAGTRTQHRMACNIEDAGFEIRDVIAWVYGSGFPKSVNLSAALGTKLDYADREHLEDWGTALKPAMEPITMARKPLIGTIAENWMEHGTGALNIGGCRIETNGEAMRAGAGAIPCRNDPAVPRVPPGRQGEASADRSYQDSGATDFAMKPGPRGGAAAGRWPANLVHDGSDDVLEHFPDDAGAASPVTVRNGDKFRSTFGAFKGDIDEEGSTFQGDEGSAARFYYCAKASVMDREEGLDLFVRRPVAFGNQAQAEVERGNLEHKGNSGMNTIKMRANAHPTVKPTTLMRWLCRMVTPPGGLVLDPYAGSGSTGKAAMLEGFRFIGMELESEHFPVAVGRVKFGWYNYIAETAQGSLF